MAYQREGDPKLHYVKAIVPKLPDSIWETVKKRFGMEEIPDLLTYGNYYTAIYHISHDKNITSYDPFESMMIKTNLMKGFIEKNKDTKLYATKIYYFDNRTKKGDRSEMALELRFGNQMFYMIIYAHRNGTRETQKRGIINDPKTVCIPIERTELEYTMEGVGWKN